MGQWVVPPCESALHKELKQNAFENSRYLGLGYNCSIANSNLINALYKDGNVLCCPTCFPTSLVLMCFVICLHFLDVLCTPA